MTTASGMDRLFAHAMARSIPLSVLVELTLRCNLDCSHCYVDHRAAPDELTTDEVRRILDELRAAGTLFLTFSGGEMFLRRDWAALARRARELGFALRLFSNGTLIDARVADAIAAIGVLEVELSVYSADAARHDAVTARSGSHALTLRAARLLRERDVAVCLKAPLMRGMPADHRGVTELARELGADRKFDPTVVARDNQDPTPLQLRLSPAELQEVCADPGLGLAVDAAQAGPPDPDAPNCAVGRRVALISANGQVFPCSQRFPSAGSLREQSFGEIWQTSPLLLRLRNITAQDLGWCSSCEKLSFCGRCFLDARGEDGDFWGPSSWAGALAAARLAASGAGGVTKQALYKRRFGDRRPVCEF